MTSDQQHHSPTDEGPSSDSHPSEFAIPQTLEHQPRTIRMSRALAERRRRDAIDTLMHRLGTDQAKLMASLPLPTAGKRAKQLVIIRESTAYNNLLLSNMVDLTLAASHLAGLPAVQIARRLGATPLDVNASPNLRAVRVRRSREHLAIYEIDGIWFVLSGATGALFDDRGENFFCEIITALMQLLLPVEVSAAYVARLGRSIPVLNRVQNTFLECCDIVHVEGRALDVSDPVGTLLLSVMMAFAAGERDHIVRRMMVGKVHSYRQGEWVLGDFQVPYGYRLQKNVLVPDDDPEAIDRTRQALRALADPTMNSVQLAAKLGDIGLMTRKLSKHNPESRNFSELNERARPHRSLLRYAELYRTGSLTVRYTNRVEGVDEVAGMPVERDDRGSHFSFKYSPGVPPGAWGPPEVLDAVAARLAGVQQNYAATGTHAHQHRLPLLGIPYWDDGGRTLRLTSCGMGISYKIKVVDPGRANR